MTHDFSHLADLMVELGVQRDQVLDSMDEHLLMAALRWSKGNMAQAARRLGMHRNWLARRVKELENVRNSKDHCNLG